jgi:Predicted Zn-dependent protease (DUF2268)
MFRLELIAWLFGPALALAQSEDPLAAHFVTSDLDHFWEAYDAAGPDYSPGVFERLYFARGSAGLEDFVAERIGDSTKLVAAIRKYPRYYAALRESTAKISGFDKAMRASFMALEYLYPPAVYPDVYFLIGRMNSGGTTSERALLIGADMYGRTAGSALDELDDWRRQVVKSVDEIPYIVAHELVHFAQHYPDDKSLLAAAITEGTADFIGELISGRHINAAVHVWAAPREAGLWQEFKARMHGTDYGGWLYSSQAGRPNDLGYWMGYRIVACYYDAATDKGHAVRDILNIDDFERFLGESGYPGPRCGAAAENNPAGSKVE